MGFDLYGLNPKTTVKKPDRPVGMYEEGVPQPSKEALDKYFNALSEYQDADGTYFRNNVWWWRRLADFVYNETGCISDEDFPKWHTNEGHQVSEQEAIAIADQLQMLLDNGTVAKHEEEINTQMERASKENEKVDEAHKKLAEKVKQETGKENLAPADYPKADYEEWNRIQGQYNYNSSYPFKTENVREFINFCRSSGGFEIC